MLGTEEYYQFLNSGEWETIMGYNENQLESSHTFIQWIFPTTKPSQFNNRCPVITVKELRTHPDFINAKLKMKVSLSLMKKHWGIRTDDTVDIPKFKRLNGHNGLRMSRVIQSLVYHDLIDEALNLLEFVKSKLENLNVRKENGITIWECRFNEAKCEILA